MAAELHVVPGREDANWLGNRSSINTTEGNDFWLTYLTNNAIETNNPSLNLSVYAASEDSVDVMVEVDGRLLGAIHIPPGGGKGKLDRITPAQVYIPANESEQRKNVGVHVYAKDKRAFFSCYVVNETGAESAGSTRDASLVLPTRMLGKEYLVQTYPNDTRATEFAVVATEDNTNVIITPKVQTSKKSPADTPIRLNGLRKGEVYLIRSDDPAEVENIDLSGSTVCATKPVAVFQGNEATKIASGSTGSFSVNHAFEQTLPVANWGREFYLGITEKAKSNFYNVIAAYDKTLVWVNNAAKPDTLNAGESFEVLKALVSPVSTTAKIKTDKPIMVNNYLSCGGANTEDHFDDAGNYTLYSWGNSTSAMIPAWEMRVNKMAFFTDTIVNETKDGIAHMYVQVVTKATDVATFELDGVAVPADTFDLIAADNSMAVANIELPDTGLHVLTTTGSGFVGFVYTITSEARAYQYTLGFAPTTFKDSLYVENTASVMSPQSYNLERVDGKGWYQRQLGEWVRSRLDTVSVCDDSTKIQWLIESPTDTLFRVDSIHWVITMNNELIAEKDTILPKDETIHHWEYIFAIPEEAKEARIPHLDYKVQAVLYRIPLMCADVQTDTMQTMVRVHTMYNDTVWKIVCAGEEFKYFSDTTLTDPSERFETTFYYTPTDEINALEDTMKYKYHLGMDTISKQYIHDILLMLWHRYNRFHLSLTLV